MNPFEFALAVVALVLVFNVFKVALRQKAFSRPDDTVNAELAERLAQVEERVRVLERIVTDERDDLRRQFKDLGA